MVRKPYSMRSMVKHSSKLFYISFFSIGYSICVEYVMAKAQAMQSTSIAFILLVFWFFFSGFSSSSFSSIFFSCRLYWRSISIEIFFFIWFYCRLVKWSMCTNHCVRSILTLTHSLSPALSIPISICAPCVHSCLTLCIIVIHIAAMQPNGYCFV